MIKKIILNNLIKHYIKTQKKYLIIDLNKNDLKYLNHFINLGVIKFIKKLIKNKYILYFNYKSFLKIKNMYKPGKKIIIKLKKLKLISLKKKKIFLISTNSGIILSKNAEFLKKGGLLISLIGF